MARIVPAPIIAAVPDEHQALFKSINAYIKIYMSDPEHDNSHDYHHILRVVSNAKTLLEAESKANPEAKFDTALIFLSALMHDVGDHKYSHAGDDHEGQVSLILQQNGAPKELADKVQIIVKHVGYTNEVQHPDSVTKVLSQYPELAIVQDADRLDAIGAVGIARCFAFGGAKGKGRPLSEAIVHFHEKLYRLPAMMKTAAGKELAETRINVMKEFESHFNKEAELSLALE